VPARVLQSSRGGFRADLERAKSVVGGWLEEVNEASRTEEPLSELRIAMQCGGSDAFSGVSANPLVGWVTREVVRHGGIANLAETDELIGAERYVLKNVKDVETARRFSGRSSGSRSAWAGTGTRRRTTPRAATTSAGSTTSP
jgi:altronate dehydratase